MSFEEGQNFTVAVERLEENSDEMEFFRGLKKATEIEEHHEGQLAVDVAETREEIIIVAPMAGAPKESVELHLHNDLLTLRGERHSPVPDGAYYHFNECYWGRFSRSIVLPADVHLSLARAEYRSGLLIVRLPKVKIDQNIPITIIEE